MHRLLELPSGDALLSAVITPLRHLDTFARLGVPPPRGILLHGRPGAGKTSLAHLVAATARANFVEVHSPQVEPM